MRDRAPSPRNVDRDGAGTDPGRWTALRLHGRNEYSNGVFVNQVTSLLSSSKAEPTQTDRASTVRFGRLLHEGLVSEPRSTEETNMVTVCGHPHNVPSRPVDRAVLGRGELFGLQGSWAPNTEDTRVEVVAELAPTSAGSGSPGSIPL